MVDLAAGGLVIRAAKTAYDLWKENRAEAALALTDDAKAVLKSMQSDTTGNGILLDVTGMGTSALRLLNPYQSSQVVETTRRVVAELEAKGLIEPHRTERNRGGVKLTHLGWILDPQTGKADKVG